MNRNTNIRKPQKEDGNFHKASHSHRPEVRDNLDSRSNLEQENKGKDTTHNKKETKKNHLKNRS